MKADLDDVVLITQLILVLFSSLSAAETSAVGDPGMTKDGLRVAFEAWNFCNEVGPHEAPSMGSPRAADCFHLLHSTHHPITTSTFPLHPLPLPFLRQEEEEESHYSLHHKVSESDNKLGVGTPFPGLPPTALNNTDLYAVHKEHYLASLCQVPDTPNPYHFWMIMLKNGNYDSQSGLCPENGKMSPPFPPGRFPCPSNDCMNQPLLYHQPTYLNTTNNILAGSFNGTYDFNSSGSSSSISYFEVTWEKKVGSGSWVFNHKLRTSKLYPWLMLYLRADATKGFSGGYHYDTRGMLKILPESPSFKVRLSLDVKKGGGPKSQFYLIDMGSCWKNNGHPCNGDVQTDITRYSEMIINPDTPAWCAPTALANCPPFHITPNNTKIYRNDTANFPYGAYHYYCAPGNAQHLEKPYSTCDPYSNPQAQELVQLLPHPIWADYGYPTKQGDGWVGDARTWELDVGPLSSRLYFYQDPGTKPATRIWTSLDVGTEIFVSDKDEVAEWTLSDFDVILTSTTT